MVLLCVYDSFKLDLPSWYRPFIMPLMNKTEMKANAERKRQGLVAEQCSDAINALLDDTGPLYQLPPNIRAMIQGELDSVVRTLTAEMESAEEKSEIK